MNNQNQIRNQFQIHTEMEIDLESGFHEQTEFNRYIASERETEIEKIRCDSQVLNEIMLDLVEMVNNQGESVKQISKQTNNAKKKLEKTLIEIRKTEKYKESQIQCCNFCIIC